MLEHPRFRAAYDFLLLRSETGEAAEELADWWTDFQKSDEAQRNSMLRANAGGGGGQKKRRRRPRKRKPQA